MAISIIMVKKKNPGSKWGSFHTPRHNRNNSFSCFLIPLNSPCFSALSDSSSVFPFQKSLWRRGSSFGSNECTKIVSPRMMKAVRLYMGSGNCSPHCLSKEQSCWEQQILQCYVKTHYYPLLLGFAGSHGSDGLGYGMHL